MNISFKDSIRDWLISLLTKKLIAYEVKDYVAISSDEEMVLTDINWKGGSVTIAEDFVLANLGQEKYEFESWRYENFDKLKHDLLSNVENILK